ncbi:hypothetical protein FHX82_003867 [Amycolatopsis bartoniae]|uniref:DUF2064 domain-containing protein n=1 Tax=Amycolatopsis bartoniae TaxID=941986 RepID=A0A8H9IUQ7_9PSEU|nr:DUF2064 domain-containing protein [Amycolatopsis bartoniae]MBB2936803.1 hypothetical protein [Amycolatopsis bartoniae]TVT09152.1 DUF2064 domain-containing protein [Amycolatopsis bartoniae]GHF50241.1 hypothetical protein GCM10017566_24190 [Amycolatopsis bartoniae]
MTRIVLVVAKAPVAGRVKTRLTPAVTPHQAADIAAAALLDTLATALSTPDSRVLVALHGDPTEGERASELHAMLSRCEIFPQRGEDFPARLAHAHADVAARYPGAPVVQIGMDTPQVTAGLLTDAFAELASFDAVLGPAVDGGWWCLGLNDPAAAGCLATVTMSRGDTGSRTLGALRARGNRVGALPILSDVDNWADARALAVSVPGSRFAAAVADVVAC